MHKEVQHIRVELLGVLQKRKVTHLWLNEQSTVGDVVRREERILALNRLIVIRVYDPDRYLDAGKILSCPIRLRVPHFGDLGEERIIFGWCRRELFIFLPGSGNKRSENGALIDILDTARVRICGKRKKFRKPLGVMHSDVEPDNGAIAPTDQGSFVDFKKIHQGENIGSH